MAHRNLPMAFVSVKSVRRNFYDGQQILGLGVWLAGPGRRVPGLPHHQKTP